MTPTTIQDTWLDLADAPPVAGLRFRRPHSDEADYEATAEVIVAANRHDGIPWMPLARHLREDWEGSLGIDPLTDCLIAEIDGQVIAEGGVERRVHDGIAVYHLDGHVRPEYRRRGLGRAILRENIRRATERSAGEEAGHVIELRSQAEESEAGNRALLEAHGFAPIRWFFMMRRRNLGDVPNAPLPDGLEIRPVTPDQHRAIFDAEVEAFRDHWSAMEKTDEDLDTMLGKKELDTDLWVVAWDGDQIAGVVQNWIWPEENAALGVDSGWLEHISVRRPWRRRGLARAITAESLRRIAAAGMTDGRLGVDAENPNGALGLYEGLGFEVAQRWTTFRRQFRG
jgi:mycothiol synthase